MLMADVYAVRTVEIRNASYTTHRIAPSQHADIEMMAPRI